MMSEAEKNYVRTWLYMSLNFCKISHRIKFGFSEKATKFEKIFVVLLKSVFLSESRRRFLKTNVVKSYYTNFNKHFPIRDFQEIVFIAKSTLISAITVLS